MYNPPSAEHNKLYSRIKRQAQCLANYTCNERYFTSFMASNIPHTLTIGGKALSEEAGKAVIPGAVPAF